MCSGGCGLVYSVRAGGGVWWLMWSVYSVRAGGGV